MNDARTGTVLTREWRIAALRLAVHSSATVSHYRRLTLPATTSGGCELWAGSVFHRGAGRFWISEGCAVAAHHFGFALAHGTDTVREASQLIHECGNPLCQRIGHIRVRAESEHGPL